MDIIESMRVQKAVYWAPTGTDQFNRRTYAAPVEIDCRWVDVREIFRTKDGQEKVSKSKVYADRVLDEEGGVLREGTLAELSSTLPFENTNTWEIQSFGKLPTLDGDDILYTAML